MLPNISDKNVFRKNFNDTFFQTDLLEDSTNIINIRFDAIGCLYPPAFDNSSKLDSLYNKVMEGSKVEYFETNSFYKFQNAKDSEFSKLFYKILNSQWHDFNAEKNQDCTSAFNVNCNELYFLNKWNEKWLTEKAELINKKILSEGYSKIVVYLHGFNVPYSLANVQAKALKSKYSEIDSAKILYVRVFWPALRHKKIVDRNNKYFTKNKFSLKTKRQYKYVVIRSYMIGLALRDLVNKIGKPIPIMVIAHSLGTNIALTSSLDLESKLRNSYSNKTKTGKRNYLLENIIQVSKTLPVPKNKPVVNLLNAPAVSGKLSFAPLDSSCRNIRWYIGYNPDDKILNRKWIIQLKEKGDNTRLGANSYCDLEVTREYLQSKNILSSFTFMRSGIQKDILGHDLFCYMLQPGFQQLFYDFAIKLKTE
ncbi:MAG: alpha/beta hydrolase [Bacteroidetes bacterium]|nr:alpha/beta hydrolase [Bacteroidota bacterium]